MKGVPIPEEVKEEVLRLYALGRTYEGIFSATGVSAAACSKIVNERAKEDPDLQALREVASYLREHKKPIESLQRATVFDERAEAAGSSFDEMESLLPLKKKYGDKLSEHIRKADAYDKLVEETGYTHPQLVAEHSRLAGELESKRKEVATLKSQTVGLNAQVETATSRLTHVKDLEAIDASLKRIGKDRGEAAKTLAKCEWFLKMGLDEKVMDAVVTQLAKKGYKGVDGPKRIGELVERFGSLEEAVTQEERLLNSLKTEKARLTSDRSFLSEKVATLKKQCKDVDARRKQLASDASAEETQFRERRAELEQKLTSIENDIKAASTRLRELQSQHHDLDNQIAQKRTEVGTLDSQKAAESRALSDLEAKKKTVLQDYQIVSRDLTALRSRHDELSREHKDFVAGATQTVATVERKITDLKGELETLRNAKSEVEKALATCREMLDKIGQAIAGKQSLVALMSLLNDPKTSLKPKDALEPVVSALKAARDYVQSRSGEIPRSGELIAALDQAIRVVTEVLRVASR